LNALRIGVGKEETLNALCIILDSLLVRTRQ
jgi:hypothetical protein